MADTENREGMDASMRQGSQAKSEGTVSKDLLQHAAWHCLFGSAAVQREPERADVDAAKILNDLRDAAKRDAMTTKA